MMCKTEYAEGGAKLHHPPPKIGLRDLTLRFLTFFQEQVSEDMKMEMWEACRTDDLDRVSVCR